MTTKRSWVREEIEQGFIWELDGRSIFDAITFLKNLPDYGIIHIEWDNDNSNIDSWVEIERLETDKEYSDRVEQEKRETEFLTEKIKRKMQGISVESAIENMEKIIADLEAQIKTLKEEAE